MEIFLTVWVVVLGVCLLEAYFCTKLDPESEKFMKEREKKNNDLYNR